MALSAPLTVSPVASCAACAAAAARREIGRASCRERLCTARGARSFQAEDGIRDTSVTGVQTCALPIYSRLVEIPAFRNLFGGRNAYLAPNCQRPLAELLSRNNGSLCAADRLAGCVLRCVCSRRRSPRDRKSVV